MSRDRQPLILVVDDDRDVRALLRAHLAERSCTLLEAVNGADGIEQIVTSRPDLVILDVMMPEVNGWEVARWMRSRPEYADTKLLILTGIGERINALTSPLHGADASLDKPFRLDALDEKLADLLGAAGFDWPRP